MIEKTIYKWGPLGFDKTKIRGRFVHVGCQEGSVYVWTEQELDVNIRYLERTVRLCPTGGVFTGEYFGTVVMPSGLVWHVIEGDE